MEKVIHRAEERGRGEYDWLKTRYSFSFANWFEPARMGFGALRVINDDWIAPANGFGAHPHRDMEIVTIVTKGTITHEDSMGNYGEVPAGDVQAMSAGTGVVHAERNDSPDEDLTLFQLWIATGVPGATPRYAQKPFGLEDMTPGLRVLIGPDGTPDALPIYQDAYISMARLDTDTPLTYTLHDPAHGVYVFVVEGGILLADETLGRRDAMGISEVESIILTADAPATALVIEVPL